MMDETHKPQQRCPVCHMNVDDGNIDLEYQKLRYWFCSQQCRDRFLANPYLYIGRPGHPAPKQQGHEIIKKRKLVLAEPLTDSQSDQLTEDLKKMMGIIDVKIESECVYICYDLMQSTLQQIESTIEKTGNQLIGGLGTRLKQAFIQYLEESELDNLEQPGQSHRH